MYDELLTMIQSGESETLELRRTGKLLYTTLAKIIVAFLNTKGGKLVIGVNDGGQVLGIEQYYVDRLRSVISEVLPKRIRPAFSVKFESLVIDNKNVVVVTVPEGTAKPYGYSGVYFKRFGGQIVEYAKEDLVSFFGGLEEYNERTVAEILEKVKSLENILKERVSNKIGTNIFISHGHQPEVKALVEEFLETLELNPIVVKDEASGGMSVDDKVEHYMKKCEAAIIIFTPDDKLQDGTFVPRQNVIHETGLLENLLKGKIIYVKDKKTNLPSNIKPKVYATIDGENLTQAFLQIIRELKSFELI